MRDYSSVFIYYIHMTSITILRKPGFILNPDDRTVNSIFRLLGKNNGHCPCNNPDKGTDNDICPCRSYREDNHCCCALYVPCPQQK